MMAYLLPTCVTPASACSWRNGPHQRKGHATTPHERQPGGSKGDHQHGSHVVGSGWGNAHGDTGQWSHSFIQWQCTCVHVHVGKRWAEAHAFGSGAEPHNLPGPASGPRRCPAHAAVPAGGWAEHVVQARSGVGGRQEHARAQAAHHRQVCVSLGVTLGALHCAAGDSSPDVRTRHKAN